MPSKPKQKSKTFQEHKTSWGSCKSCGLCEGRDKIVLARGSVPCDVLFVGEAPGGSEDVLGRPFVGPAGKLLDQIVERATEVLEGSSVKVLYTNLIACIPLDPEQPTKKMTEPPDWAIKACGSRLNDLTNLSKAKAIVMVGRLSSKWAPKIIKRDFEHSAEILHPAAILRADVSQQGLAIQKCIATLEDLFTKIKG